MPMLMPAGYLPPEVIEHEGKMIYPDHTAQLKRGSDISDVVSRCKIKKGTVASVYKAAYPRYCMGFEDWRDWAVDVNLESGEAARIILGPHMRLLTEDLGLHDAAELTGRRVSCYAMHSPTTLSPGIVNLVKRLNIEGSFALLEGDTPYLGISVDE